MPTDGLSYPVKEALVADDEPDVCELLAEYLRSRGFTVATASDGRAAVSAIERESGRFSLVFTDLQMPGADGLAVLKAARQANPRTFVVIITGYASLDSAIQAVRLGAHDYLTKPFSLGQIEVIIKRMEERQVLEMENRQLMRQAGRDQTPTQLPVMTRLDDIERRLASIELVLRTLAGREGREP